MSRRDTLRGRGIVLIVRGQREIQGGGEHHFSRKVLTLYSPMPRACCSETNMTSTALATLQVPRATTRRVNAITCSYLALEALRARRRFTFKPNIASTCLVYQSIPHIASIAVGRWRAPASLVLQYLPHATVLEF